MVAPYNWEDCKNNSNFSKSEQVGEGWKLFSATLTSIWLENLHKYNQMGALWTWFQ